MDKKFNLKFISSLAVSGAVGLAFMHIFNIDMNQDTFAIFLLYMITTAFIISMTLLCMEPIWSERYSKAFKMNNNKKPEKKRVLDIDEIIDTEKHFYFEDGELKEFKPCFFYINKNTIINMYPKNVKIFDENHIFCEVFKKYGVNEVRDHKQVSFKDFYRLSEFLNSLGFEAKWSDDLEARYIIGDVLI